MIIRQEEVRDYCGVFELVEKAFATSSFNTGTETAEYLNDIRKKPAFIPELSLVAIENHNIVGQIVLYEMEVYCTNKNITQLVISPLSVLPTHFNQGIGTKLLTTGCEKAKDMGYNAVFLCGDFNYYSRLGFVPTYEYGIYHREDESKDAKWCMVKELTNGFLSDITGFVDIL